MENDRKTILATLTGVAGGVIIGLLLAPEKGKDTRERITQKGDNYLKEVKKELDGIRGIINKRAAAAKEGISELGQSAKSKRDDMLKKAKKITSYDEWTKDELYQRAKKEEIDGYSTMNKGELIEALRNQ